MPFLLQGEECNYKKGGVAGMLSTSHVQFCPISDCQGLLQFLIYPSVEAQACVCTTSQHYMHLHGQTCSPFPFLSHTAFKVLYMKDLGSVPCLQESYQSWKMWKDWREEGSVTLPPQSPPCTFCICFLPEHDQGTKYFENLLSSQAFFFIKKKKKG